MGTVIALDTNVFIYALDDNPQFGEAARNVFTKIKQRAPQTCTSVLTIEEVFVGVYKYGFEDKIIPYLEFISGYGLITIIDVSRTIAMRAAKLRAEYKLRTPDAIQIATGLAFGAKSFITADKRLPKKIESLTVSLL